MKKVPHLLHGIGRRQMRDLFISLKTAKVHLQAVYITGWYGISAEHRFHQV